MTHTKDAFFLCKESGTAQEARHVASCLKYKVKPLLCVLLYACVLGARRQASCLKKFPSKPPLCCLIHLCILSRLNGKQSLELAFHIANRLRRDQGLLPMLET